MDEKLLSYNRKVQEAVQAMFDYHLDDFQKAYSEAFTLAVELGFSDTDHWRYYSRLLEVSS